MLARLHIEIQSLLSKFQFMAVNYSSEAIQEYWNLSLMLAVTVNAGEKKTLHSKPSPLKVKKCCFSVS